MAEPVAVSCSVQDLIANPGWPPALGGWFGSKVELGLPGSPAHAERPRRLRRALAEPICTPEDALGLGSEGAQSRLLRAATTKRRERWAADLPRDSPRADDLLAVEPAHRIGNDPQRGSRPRGRLRRVTGAPDQHSYDPGRRTVDRPPSQ